LAAPPTAPEKSVRAPNSQRAGQADRMTPGLCRSPGPIGCHAWRDGSSEVKPYAMSPKKPRNTDLACLRDTPPWEWSAGAAGTLARTLLDSGARRADRLLAAELAADIPSPTDELVEALLTVLQDPAEPAALRSQAAVPLGPILEYADEFSPEDVAGILPVLDAPPLSPGELQRIQALLHKVYQDGSVPEPVRRQILEASVRAPQDWHRAAIRAAYSTGRRDWMLTAVWCMRFVVGFGEQILEALLSDDPQIQFHAVRAAGNWGLDAAWPYVASLIDSEETVKDVLLAAIEAAACIRPREAADFLLDLLHSGDDDVVETVHQALAMIEDFSDDDDDPVDDDAPWDGD